jgi:TonB-dependent starch-binding outer membrane protein SusC
MNFITLLTNRNFVRSKLLMIFFLMFQLVVFGQGKQITGKITDVSGSSLPGVNVFIKGTTIGTTSDFDGNYSITIKKDNDVLVFSFVGYNEQSMSVGNQSQINVIMKEDVLQLDEVVAIGYGIQKKSDITGSVSSIKAESLKSMPATRIDEAIQGKAAGVMVLQNSGQPGASPVIRVRGLATVNGGNPLIIIDGVSGGSLGDLNPADIESIEILKDAASQGIYGSAGGNGVILVTTKKGASGKIKVNLDAFAGLQQPWDINVQVADGQQFAAIYNQYRRSIGGAEFFPYKEDTGLYYSTLDNTKALESTNWLEEIFRTALMQNYNLSISGGGKVSNFYFSAGYSGQEGTLLRTMNNKFTLRLNSDHKIASWLKVGENFSFTNNVNSGQDERNEYSSPMSTAIQMLPFVPVFVGDDSGNYAFKQSGMSSNIKNPMAQIAYNNNQSTGNTMIGNVYLRADILKGLSFETRFGLNYYESKYLRYIPVHTIGATTDAHPTQSVSISDYSWNENSGQGWQWQNFLTYNFSLNKNNFTVVAGMESGRYNYSFINRTKNHLDILPEEFLQYSDTTGFAILQESEKETSGYAYFGRLTYDYDGILLLQANFRRDFSSKFGPNNRVGNFPSISAGIKFSEFDFIKNLNIIDFGKLRVGYGQTGNSDIQPFLYLNSFGPLPINGYSFNGSTVSQGAALLTAANDDLKWETVITKNIGLDLGLFNNRLSLTVDLFERSNKDMLLRKSVPLTVGYMITDANTELGDASLDTRPLVNYGTLNNRGIEGMISYKDKIGDFKFEVNANMTRAITIIDDIGDPLMAGSGRGFSNVCRTVVGESVSSFYGYKIQGIYQESDFTWFKDKGGKWVRALEDPEGSLVLSNTFDIDRQPITIKTSNPSAKPGSYRYVDVNKDGKIDAQDITNIGDPNPQFVYGFGGNMEYKGFDMNFFFQGSYGNQIFNMLKVNLYNANNGGLNLSPEMINSYIPALYNTDDRTIAPIVTSQAGNLETGLPRMDGDLSSSEFYVEDGSYIRLKNIQIGYTLPQHVSSKIKAERLRFYIGAKNLLTFTKYTGFDPEVGETTLLERGFDRGTYPQSRMFVFGVNASF